MRPPVLFPLFAPLATLRGVGPRLGPLLERAVGGPMVRDVVMSLPTGVIDRQAYTQLRHTPDGAYGTFTVTVEAHFPGRFVRHPYRIRVFDGSGWGHVTYFHKPRDIEQLLPVGQVRVISGKVEHFGSEIQIPHPDYVLAPDQGGQLPGLEPVYALTNKLPAKVRLRGARTALQAASPLPEWLDPAFVHAQNWPDWYAAITQAHAPATPADLLPLTPARSRLAYDEVLSHQLTLALARRRRQKRQGRSFALRPDWQDRARAALPFALTSAQEQAVSEILGDMTRTEPMARLVQGDVGAGKTVVAWLAMVHAAAHGAQAALMAPTEVLARQHAASLTPWAQALGLELVVLTGRDKGKARQEKLAALAGSAAVAIGTHALFSEDVAFRDLGLVVVDEQHRFGVAQRLALADKGRVPDVLVMSATPIPRTLELATYGDLDISRLDAKPPGRKAIETLTVSLSRLDEVVDGLQRALASGDKIYWICPLVAESEVSDLAAATARFDDLRNRLGPQVGLVHGQMKAPEKDAALAAFQAGQIRLLVATTVVEVGVDAPDATVMVIEHAERFGLAQLHQLRGRVGRSHLQSRCILLYQGPLGETSKARLAALRQSNDGFWLAEEDWRLRGGGDPIGLRQSGLPDFRFADIHLHADLLRIAADDARLVLHRDPDLTSPRGQACRVLLHLFDRAVALRLLSS